jgi:hypothetical protein
VGKAHVPLWLPVHVQGPVPSPGGRSSAESVVTPSQHRLLVLHRTSLSRFLHRARVVFFAYRHWANSPSSVLRCLNLCLLVDQRSSPCCTNTLLTVASTTSSRFVGPYSHSIASAAASRICTVDAVHVGTVGTWALWCTRDLHREGVLMCSCSWGAFRKLAPLVSALLVVCARDPDLHRMSSRGQFPCLPGRLLRLCCVPSAH